MSDVLAGTQTVLLQLKDFQRRTAEYAFKRMYIDDDCTHRFLIADEVGLGKTMVAKGIVAKTVEHLWDKCPRIDIIYMCSSGDIARQNLNRLRIPGVDSPTEATRLTLLPLVLSRLELRKGEGHRVNFISLTPGTSFQMGWSNGNAEERVVIYHLLDLAWGTSGRSAPYNVLHCGMDRGNFERLVWSRDYRETLEGSELTKTLVRRLRKERALRKRWDELCSALPRRRSSESRIPQDVRNLRNQWIKDARAIVAQECLAALEPDLVILDEFQRFKTLLNGEDDAAQLAHDLFAYSDDHAADAGSAAVRTLLLSATPYKMYTRSQEGAGEDHYQDFLDTMDFLRFSEGNPSDLQILIEDYRKSLYDFAESGGEQPLRNSKTRLERELRRFMARTERLASTGDRNGMLEERNPSAVAPSSTELAAYREMQSLAREVGQPDVMEYWKSSPYLLSFLTKYRVHEDILTRMGDDREFREEVLSRISRPNALTIARSQIQKFEALDAGNARLRWLAEETIESGMWQMLWLPPSMPYYQPDGPFQPNGPDPMTKRLVFSSWTVVPRAVASMLSYHAERLMLSSDPEWDEKTAEYSARRQRRPLRFQLREGVLGAPTLWTLTYPSHVLADAIDPLRIGADLTNAELPTAARVLEAAEQTLKPLISEVVDRYSSEEASSASATDWYWAAPMSLDYMRDPELVSSWLDWSRLSSVFTSDTESIDDENAAAPRGVDAARDIVEGRAKLGAPPDDLARVVALIALGSPCVCTLRSLMRSTNEPETCASVEVMDAAASASWGFRAMLNTEESISVIRGSQERGPYWRQMLTYGVAGCLQAVLDEYTHLLVENVASADKPFAEIAGDATGVMRDVTSLNAALLRPVVFDEDGSKGELRLRSHFALPFSDTGDTEEKAGRLERVREAFNSPFKPFVLATTSVGQEGLDFHRYCHAVVHWNLPSNPVDLEQREGRVHRYKGHAVRKNVARRFSSSASPEGDGVCASDPWSTAFTSANASKSDSASDLVPYWVFPEAPAPEDDKIVRQVPFAPLSRDANSYDWLKRSLVVYRMVFGQARQDDLVSYILEKRGGDAAMLESLEPINLEPPRPTNA